MTAEMRSEIIELAPQAAQAIKHELHELAVGLERSLTTLEPLTTIGLLAIFETTSTFGTYHEPSERRSEVPVEIVTGLYASIPLEDDPSRPTRADLIALMDRIAELRRVSLHYSLADGLASDAAPEVVSLRIATARSWQTVRGSAYHHHARSLARAVLGKATGAMRRQFGFSVDDYLAVVDRAHEIVQERLNIAIRPLSAGGAADRAFETLRDVPLLTASDLATPALSEELIHTVVSRLALRLPSATPLQYSGPFDACPLTDHPFVSTPDASVFLIPLFGIALREVLTVFDRALLAEKRYPRVRADAADDYALDLIERALPGCRVASHVFYTLEEDGSVLAAEVDGIVTFEDYMIVIEGKANSLSVPAQRGDVSRAANDLRDSIGSAWKQCQRVSKFLTSEEVCEFRDSKGKVALSVTKHKASQVVLINPLLYPIGLIAFEIPTIRTMTTLPADREPWSVLISDLEVITDMIRSPAELLHYIHWRSQLPLGTRMDAMDELDLFGSYLFGEVGRAELGEDDHQFFASSTVDFDSYYMGVLGEGPEVNKPRRVLGSLVEARLGELATERPFGWLNQSFALLSLSLHEAAAIDAWLTLKAVSLLGKGPYVVFQVGDAAAIAIPWTANPQSHFWNYVAAADRLLLVVTQVRPGRSRIVWSRGSR